MEKNLRPEILVVDDDIEAAQSFAEYITVCLKISATFESDIENVIELIKQGGIKVVILDQRMPTMSGTELYKKIQEFNPYIKAIMLTGEADRNEVAKALEMGYVSYLEKNNIQALPTRVLIAYTKYQTELYKNSDLKDFIPVKVWNPLKNCGYLTSYDISSFQEITPEYVFEDKWRPTLELDAAEKEVEDTYEFTKDIILQENTEFRSSLKSALSIIDLSKIKTEINSAITNHLGMTHKWTLRKKKKIKTIYRLQDGVEKGKQAVKKIYERTPLYIQYYIIIRKTCRICRKVQLYPCYVYTPIPKEKTRVRIYYSDGSNSNIDTGIVAI